MSDESKMLLFYVAMTLAMAISLGLLRVDGLSVRVVFLIGVPVLTVSNLLYLKARHQPKGSRARKVFEWVVGLSTTGLAYAHLLLDRK